MTTPDLVIRNALVIDGSGAPGRHVDVAVTADRISLVAPIITQAGRREIDATGLALAPGFIDAHTHDDRAVLAKPDHACKTSQGCTTVVVGNCGISLAPLKLASRPPAPLDLIAPDPSHLFARFADYFAALDAAPPAVNVVAQCGHSSLRVAAMADWTKPATPAEIAAMRDLFRQALEDGAAGFSTGLEYPLSRACEPSEVEQIAAAGHDFGVFYSTHMRSEGDKVLDSLGESFAVGRKAKLAVVISHHKCVGTANHGRSTETLACIETARGDLNVGLDAYPYIASSTMLDIVRINRSRRTMIAWSTPYPQFKGRDFAEVCREIGLEGEAAVAALSPAGAIYFQMDEQDVRRILAYPPTMIGSDGLPHDTHPHPRLWGTFPRVLGHYARDERLFPLEEAVRKMTSLTAETFGLTDRGLIGEGLFADLVLFDPATVIDLASFEAPTTPARGIAHVFVNGAEVWDGAAATGARPGRALKRQGLARLNWAA
jgi:N-acyl-D-amino-acid deacylase